MTEQSGREPHVQMLMPCSQCGGRGYLDIAPIPGGQIVGGNTRECMVCTGRGLSAQPVALSDFRRMLGET